MKRLFVLTFCALALLSAALLAGAQESATPTCDELAGSFANPNAPYFVGQGEAYLTQGNYALAIAAYGCALELEPEYTPAYANRGYAYFVQGNAGAALDDYNRALELDETFVPAYNNRGLLYVGQGRFGLALSDFDLATAFAPENPVPYNNRAIVHAIEGNYELALADLETAIALDPTFAAPHATLGVVYSAMSVRSYATYRDLAGVGQTGRLPAGDPDTVLLALQDSRATGNFSTWLPLLTPAR